VQVTTPETVSPQAAVAKAEPADTNKLLIVTAR
jgi:hypothetical protein